MFEEGGNPCFEHAGEGMCVYSVGELYGSTCNEQGCTLWTGACDLNAAGCNIGGSDCNNRQDKVDILRVDRQDKIVIDRSDNGEMSITVV